MLLLFLLLVSESVITVLFLLHQHPVLQHLLVVHHHHLSILFKIFNLQHLLLYKLQNHFGSDQQFSDGINFLQQKVRHWLLF